MRFGFGVDGRSSIDHGQQVFAHQYGEFGTDARSESIDHGPSTGAQLDYGEFGTDGRAESIDHEPAVYDHSYGEFGVDGRAASIDHEAALFAHSYGEFGVDGRAASIDHGPPRSSRTSMASSAPVRAPSRKP